MLYIPNYNTSYHHYDGHTIQLAWFNRRHVLTSAHQSATPPITIIILRLIALMVTICIAAVLIALRIGGDQRTPVLSFTSNRDGSNHIYLLDEATHLLHRLPDQTDARLQSAWSPQEALAFVGSAPLQVSIFEPDFSRITLLSHRGLWNDYQPDWSPNAHLALASDQRGNWDIVLYDANRNFTFAPFNTPANELEPCWWPDGQLSFVSDRDGNSDVYRYDFKTHTTVNLTNDPANDYNPACAVDGQLAFTTTRDYNAEVYVINLRTGLTQNVSRSVASDFNPAWLPDGRLSFVSDRDGNREIYILDLSTHQLTNITQNPADDDQPAWTSSAYPSPNATNSASR